MADLKNDRRFANLNRLSTEQLEELLRTAPLLPDSQETSEYYDAIEEVILQRETEHPTGRIQDVDSAWAEFQEQYLSSTGESARLYPEERSENVYSFCQKRINPTQKVYSVRLSRLRQLSPLCSCP